MYFDVVLNERLIPIFNDTPEKVRQWLIDHPNMIGQVNLVDGQQLRPMSVLEYLTGE